METNVKETKEQTKQVSKEGDMRVWWIRNITASPDKIPDFYPVASIEEAKELILKLAELDEKDNTVKENAFGLEVFMNRCWVEWTDEDSLDILEQF